MNRYDLIIVGSGAGLLVLEAALKHGLRCAIVENAKFGGTCLTKGCIPSKMLVYPADFIREVENSARIGIYAGRPEVDWEVISRRMWQQIDFHKTLEDHFRAMPNLKLYKGTGVFTGSNSLCVQYADGRPADLLYAERFVVAAGARSYVPPIPGLDKAGYVTSESFFGDKYPARPWKSLAIIGGGAISTEFAHIFSAFGTKVTLIARAGRILRREEEEISRFVARQFAKVGIDVCTDSTVILAEQTQAGKCLTLENRVTGRRSTLLCEEILVASGVQSNADRLAPEQAGIAVDSQGWIPTNAYLETSQKHIWAVGDINGKHQFRHKANYEAQILIHNLFSGKEKRQATYAAVPWAIFTHPQVARVGMTEQELRQRGIPYRVAKNHYSEVVGGRSMGFCEGDDDNGFVKMLVGEDKRILGVHIVGPQAALLLQPFVYLMHAGHQCKKYLEMFADARDMERLRPLCAYMETYAPVTDAMVIHPSLSELTAWVFEKLENL